MECSDLEEYTDVGGVDSHIEEKYKERDINLPQIYIRKYMKSHSCSSAQAKRKVKGNTRVYDNYHSCFYCGELRQHINVHMKSHKKIPAVKQVFEEDKPDFTAIRKLGDHKHNVKVMKEGRGEMILSRRPTVER